MSEIIKVLVSVDYIIYPKKRLPDAGEWVAMRCNIEECYEGNPKTIKGDKLSVSGTVPELNYYDKYVLIGKFTPHETYGNQYEILCMNKLVNLTSPVEQRQFL